MDVLDFLRFDGRDTMGNCWIVLGGCILFVEFSRSDFNFEENCMQTCA